LAPKRIASFLVGQRPLDAALAAPSFAVFRYEQSHFLSGMGLMAVVAIDGGRHGIKKFRKLLNSFNVGLALAHYFLKDTTKSELLRY
jgi:hypothetical protein